MEAIATVLKIELGKCQARHLSFNILLLIFLAMNEDPRGSGNLFRKCYKIIGKFTIAVNVVFWRFSTLDCFLASDPSP